MKPRHAAALALVGWYLIILPARQKTSGEWMRCEKFASQSDCEASRAKHVAHGSIVIDCIRNVQDPAQPWGIIIGIEFADAQCVATDDPRLKEK